MRRRGEGGSDGLCGAWRYNPSRAKHPAVRATRLPFGGQNLVLYVKSYDDDGPDQETDAIKHVLANKGLDDPSEMAHPA